MSFYFLQKVLSFRGEGDVWLDSPSLRGIILYSVVTPILCCCGAFGNIVSLTVLKRKELVGSVYTYLAFLACVDLSTSIVLILGGISRGIMWQYGWVTYDSLIGLPVGGALNTMGVLAIIAITIETRPQTIYFCITRHGMTAKDSSANQAQKPPSFLSMPYRNRVIYLWNPVQCTKPKFCNPWIARRLMIGSVLVAIIFNLPYCFIYKWEEDGNLSTTSFFDSTYYKALNWFTLFVFAVIPAVILLLGNGFLIMSLRKAKKINEKSNKCRTKRCKRRDHTNLTITLVMIIVFFLITNIPGSLVSRTAAINLLFQGDHDMANTDILEDLRQICTILGAIDVNTNFVFYYTFCPAFCKALKSICRRKGRRPSNNLQVNVFVLNGKSGPKANQIAAMEDKCLNKKVQRVLEISRKSIESALAFNLRSGDNEKRKNECHLVKTCDYISATPEEYAEIENDYTPPFSTILEESSSFSTSVDLLNKHSV